jgi:hypothetical protein
MKLGNAGGGKGPQLEVNATSDEEREIGDEPSNPGKLSEVADGVTRESVMLPPRAVCVMWPAEKCGVGLTKGLF